MHECGAVHSFVHSATFIPVPGHRHGGGRTTDVIHSDATHLLGWEQFTLNSLGYGVYDIQTVDGHYVTAVGGGGRTTDTIHTDATRVGAWEKFTVSCGH